MEVQGRMKPVTIYALVDPREPNVYRYIGQTTFPERRLLSHLVGSENGRGSKNEWIRFLRSEGVVVSMVPLETPEDDWRLREEHWIRHAISIGHPLLNITFGTCKPPYRNLKRSTGMPEFHPRKKISPIVELFMARLAAAESRRSK